MHVGPEIEVNNKTIDFKGLKLRDLYAGGGGYFSDAWMRMSVSIYPLNGGAVRDRTSWLRAGRCRVQFDQRRERGRSDRCGRGALCGVYFGRGALGDQFAITFWRHRKIYGRR